MHSKLIKRLTDNIDLDEGFNPNGKKMINFHFTKKNGSHLLYPFIKSSYVRLVRKKSAFFKVKEDLSKCSLYTKKVFDKYVYTTKT